MSPKQPAEAESRALWDVVGPDPLLADVGVALRRAASRPSDPNPDDPDDEAEAEE